MESNILSTESNALLHHEVILSRWFYSPTGLSYLPLKPNFLLIPRGFRLKGKLVNSIITTRNEYDMKSTNADAVFLNYFILPGNEKLSKIFRFSQKPTIVLLRHRLTLKHRLLQLAKKLETLGAAGFFTGRNFPDAELKKICNECSAPVFAYSNPDFEEITSKINAGVFAVCLSGKNISKHLISALHELFPGNPFIAMCNRSEDLISKCLETGVDAIIFKPCIPFKMDWEEF